MKSFLRNLYFLYRKRRLKVSKMVIFDEFTKINRFTVFEGRNRLYPGADLFSSHIGYGSYLGTSAKIRNTKIGRYTSIGPYVNTIFGKHPTHTFVSTHPVFFSKLEQVGITYVKNQKFKEFSNPIDPEGKYTIEVGNDVWIGAEVSILEGVKIGDGAIVASKSLVKDDVEPYTIVGGIPARKIKYRFEETERAFLLDFKWWNKSESWLKDNSALFEDIKHLAKAYKENTNL